MEQQLEISKAGFTLTELVITIALIVILSTISVPIYKGNVYSAKAAEAYALLGRIKDAEYMYLNERNVFYGDMADYTFNDTVLSINARMNKYFTLFKVSDGGGSMSFNAYVTSGDVGEFTLIFDRNKGTGPVYQ